ncbi:hypothetical protein [Holophaga foetida]|uniref:hypothetical protein n=1 Tax=Holophaga foetida TaxID=35839 RepID=UPI000247428B|nr:hypothetical protein [Holophaga foetida]
MRALRFPLIAVAVLAFSVAAQAKAPWTAKGKAVDAGVKTCASCHVTGAKAKKGDPLTERGNWLVAEKGKKKAAEVDPSWLANYPKKGK